MKILISVNSFNFLVEPIESVIPFTINQNITNQLQNAFDDGDYVVIPDSVPTPPQPDWDGFMVECSDVLAAGMQANYLVFTQIFNMLLALKGKGALDENSPEWRNFAFNYQIGKASLTPEQIAQVESSMANNNIPVLS